MGCGIRLDKVSSTAGHHLGAINAQSRHHLDISWNHLGIIGRTFFSVACFVYVASAIILAAPDIVSPKYVEGNGVSLPPPVVSIGREGGAGLSLWG